jgi:hypothetical protein
MKHLLHGAAIAAALSFATTAWAQNPSAGNAMGMPGPNPGGPGLTTYSSGQGQSSATAPAAHGHAHHGMHARHGMKRGPQLTGSNADQLNQEELARLQAGNFSNPAAPSAPGMLPGAPGPHQPGHVMGPKASSGSRALGEPGPGHVPAAGQP